MIAKQVNSADSRKPGREGRAKLEFCIAPSSADYVVGPEYADGRNKGQKGAPSSPKGYCEVSLANAVATPSGRHEG